MIGETKIEIKERHGQSLDLDSIAERIRPALEAVAADRERMQGWQAAEVDLQDVADWADNRVSAEWGKKAAARAFHICAAGKDVEFDDPFAPGNATEKPIRYLGPVPGSPEQARTKYDMRQALSFIATNRRNAEERVTWQGGIAHLLDDLHVAGPA